MNRASNVTRRSNSSHRSLVKIKIKKGIVALLMCLQQSDERCETQHAKKRFSRVLDKVG
jgi:hypothetical protein